jgi:choline dehydrogenase
MTERYSEIIVGAGSSGGALAARLTEDPPRRVLLIEGGPDFAPADVPSQVKLGSQPLMDGQFDWGYSGATGWRDRMMAYVRGKITGGSSAVNTAIALRGTPYDFERWEAFGLPEWSFEKVLPFYIALEDDIEFDGPQHRRGGPIPIRHNTWGPLVPIQAAFADACNELGYATVEDLNSLQSLVPGGAVGKLPMNVLDGVRQSTALTYLAKARSRANLTILSERTVDRVLIADGVATGVVVRHGSVEERYEADRVTLSAGALGSPAILMRSGIGDRAALSALGIETVVDLPGVGENLMDHPVGMLTLAPKPGVVNRAGPMVQIMLRYTASESELVNDMQVWMLSFIDVGGAWAEDANEIAGAAVTPALSPGLQKPKSRGKVALASTDPNVAPTVDLRYLDDDDDRRKMIEGMRLSARLTETTALSTVLDGIVGLTSAQLESDAAISDFLDETVAATLHACGTARMGRPDDRMAVVGERFEVHGVTGLRVVDASVMPEIVSVNTNVTCMMLGERAAVMDSPSRQQNRAAAAVAS